MGDNQAVYPYLPGYPPYAGDPLGGCDPYPDGAVIGEVVSPAYPWISQYTPTEILPAAYGNEFATLLPTEPLPRACRMSWYIEVFGREKVEGSTGGVELTNNATSLKVAIEWTSAQQEPHVLVADVGTGLCTVIPPCTFPKALVMVPDASQVPAIQAELPAAYSELEDLELRTTITARCTPYEFNTAWSTAQYTQSLLIPDGSTDPILHEIPAFAAEVQISASPLSGTVPSILANPLYYDFISSVTPLGVPVQLGQGGTVAALPASGVDNGTSDIPGNAKYVRVWPSAANSPATSVTLTYTLVI